MFFALEVRSPKDLGAGGGSIVPTWFEFCEWRKEHLTLTVRDFLKTFDECKNLNDNELVRFLQKRIPCENCPYSPNGFRENDFCKNPTKPYDKPEELVIPFAACRENFINILNFPIFL
jgi:hypothetical protein